MRNITFSADEHLIERAREVARERKTTLNQLFRDWLLDLAEQKKRQENLHALLEEAAKYKSGGPFTREEMNER